MSGPGAAKTISELRALSEEDLIESYDQLARTTAVGISFYQDELHRRQLERQNRLMIRLTWVIAALTAVNVVGLAASFF